MKFKKKKNMENKNFDIDSNFQEIARTSLQKQIVQQIELLIDDGKLKHGDRLPPERKLAEIFKVSRHSVREAIRTLEEKNILKSKPGSGTFVLIEDKSRVLEYIADMIGKEKKEQQEVFQFRKLLEPQIAGLAAENATKNDVLQLSKILENQKKSGEDLESVRKYDQQFHLLLARATGNSILVKIVELLTEIIDKSRVVLLINEERLMKSIKGHTLILEAVKEKNIDEAKEAMALHIADIEHLSTGSRED
ncbi:MAG: FadR family transcriptional regulator [Deltaproteobacteria bacterium]|nr:MAG: FadR family transcriptional regulator [Deltaproteobacteria bacterium]